ncbi:Os01g0855900, partial [Oryza sativa Japonica Group]
FFLSISLSPSSSLTSVSLSTHLSITAKQERRFSGFNHKFLLPITAISSLILPRFASHHFCQLIWLLLLAAISPGSIGNSTQLWLL